jgi:hypothetical protein
VSSWRRSRAIYLSSWRRPRTIYPEFLAESPRHLPGAPGRAPAPSSRSSSTPWSATRAEASPDGREIVSLLVVRGTDLRPFGRSATLGTEAVKAGTQ